MTNQKITFRIEKDAHENPLPPDVKEGAVVEVVNNEKYVSMGVKGAANPYFGDSIPSHVAIEYRGDDIPPHEAGWYLIVWADGNTDEVTHTIRLIPGEG